ncbi:PhzF family phenazine biosynthesis protein [Saccharothrix sp. S26]|uniref:PhzF family phenazine biosynthesis protein n=1 Tax=Saccharothrix sp. S26 TaxID=2907215 RepID=UPI001F21AD5A|nr:PhzF family phenazine biosynthesis protein [Saccharothrix sp. S26]MCE7000415.1 PhzF family phenazine biosynthesis protein [Saccharothrix sp. S26]
MTSTRTGVVIVDMFGVRPGRGSALDVLLAEPEVDANAAAAHARGSAADETVLVTGHDRAGRTFGTRVFNSGGETPFATHSLAGAAACLVRRGLLEPGDVERDSDTGRQRLWTDGHEVRVPLAGPAVFERVGRLPGGLASLGAAVTAGVGRGFTLVRVADDPLAPPVPDLARLDRTDLTLFAWDAGRAEVRARVFAPGFGIPEDAGCLPVAAALALAAATLDPAAREAPIVVRQVTGRGTESVFTCTAAVRGDAARVRVDGRVWMATDDERGGTT